MSPRPAASRHDESARQFLNAAAALIDAAMTDSDDIPSRLRSIKFPAALEWIRVEDVIRLAGGGPGASRKAFRQRWATRDEFLHDAVVYTLQFVDRPTDEYLPLTTRLADLDLDRFGDAIVTLATDVLRYAESQPRSYLLLHLGGALHRHPTLQDAFAETWETARTPFVTGYLRLLERLGIRMRPEWTPLLFDRALHGLADGFLIQGRIRRDVEGADSWTHVDLFAETVLAFTLGVVDLDGTSQTAREAMTAAARSGRGTSS